MIYLLQNGRFSIAFHSYVAMLVYQKGYGPKAPLRWPWLSCSARDSRRLQRRKWNWNPWEKRWSLGMAKWQPMPEVEPLRWAQMMRALNKSGLTQILHFVGLIPANTADFGVVDSVNGAAAALRMPSPCRSWYLGRKLSLEMARSSQINGVFYGQCGTCCCR
jgi:hypothetical protein